MPSIQTRDNQGEANKNSAGNKNKNNKSGQMKSNPNKKTPILVIFTTQITDMKANSEMSTHSDKTHPSTKKSFWSQCSKQTASSEEKTNETESEPTDEPTKQLERNSPNCSSSFKPKTLRLHSGTSFDRAATTTTKFPPIPEVV